MAVITYYLWDITGYNWLFLCDYTFHKWGHLVFIMVFRAITVPFGTTWLENPFIDDWTMKITDHVYKISITMFDDRRIISIDHHSEHHSSPLFIMIDHLILMFLLKHPFSSHRSHLKPCASVEDVERQATTSLVLEVKAATGRNFCQVAGFYKLGWNHQQW